MKNLTNRLLALLIAVLMLATCAACANKEESEAPVSAEYTPTPEVVEQDNAPLALSEEDEELLTVVGEDIQVLDDASFAEYVTELMYHAGSYDGTLIQLEGIYSAELDDVGTEYIYRTLVNGEEKTTAALPLRYLIGVPEEGSWLRVTAVIATGEINGAQATVLDVIAVESIEAGAAELVWTGSAHAHE